MEKRASRRAYSWRAASAMVTSEERTSGLRERARQSRGSNQQAVSIQIERGWGVLRFINLCNCRGLMSHLHERCSLYRWGMPFRRGFTKLRLSERYIYGRTNCWFSRAFSSGFDFVFSISVYPTRCRPRLMWCDFWATTEFSHRSPIVFMPAYLFAHKRVLSLVRIPKQVFLSVRSMLCFQCSLFCFLSLNLYHVARSYFYLLIFYRLVCLLTG